MVTQQSKKEYCEKAGRLTQQFEKQLSGWYSIQELVEFCKGSLLSASGLLTLLMAHYIYNAQSNLNEGRVSVVIAGAGSLLLVFGFKKCYQVITKEYLLIQYSKAVALESFLTKIPTA